jgi:hypothetical protein
MFTQELEPLLVTQFSGKMQIVPIVDASREERMQCSPPIVAFPTLLFFDADDQERKDLRIDGYSQQVTLDNIRKLLPGTSFQGGKEKTLHEIVKGWLG